MKTLKVTGKTDYRRLYQQLGYRFSSVDLLDLAFSHRSVGAVNYERLEFLGDSILNFVIGEALYGLQPKAAEGELSRLRASLVKGVTLTEIAKELELGQYLKMGSGELKSGGHRRASILADAVESIIGAIYLDSDFETCRGRILDWFATRLQNLPSAESLKDAKTRLQEWLQSRLLDLPEYSIVETSGPEHLRRFRVACVLRNSAGQSQTFEGVAGSRRKAEQDAASLALKSLLGE